MSLSPTVSRWYWAKEANSVLYTYQIEYASKLTWAFFFFLKFNDKNVNHMPWKSQKGWFYPMSPAQNILHNVILFQYIRPFHRLCVCLQSPYHTVTIRLRTKQYYLFALFSGAHEESVAKSWLHYVIEYSRQFRKHDVWKWCGAWMRDNQNSK